MRKLSVILIAWLFMNGCTTPVIENKTKNEASWKTEFNTMLPLLGHRNWILVVDKAFPMQTSQGLTIINTGEKLAPVLKYVLDQIDGSTHVQPAVYHDAELNFLTSEQVQGKEAFLSSVNQVLGNLIPVPILHDSDFVKIDRASKLFRVVVLKTEETIPYTSVFIELGCKYWSGDNEKELRKSMEEKTK
jgi:L-fucose mutarotase/ribose pyranase (RbsD/FucU family)